MYLPLNNKGTVNVLHFYYILFCYSLQFTCVAKKDDILRAHLVLTTIFIQRDSPIHYYEYLTDTTALSRTHYQTVITGLKLRITSTTRYNLKQRRNEKRHQDPFLYYIMQHFNYILKIWNSLIFFRLQIGDVTPGVANY